GVVWLDLSATPDDRHESLRLHVLPARWAARLARDRGRDHAEPVHGVRVVGRAPAGARRAGRDGVLVLALRGRGVGRGLQRGLRDRPMTPRESETTRATGAADPGMIELPAPTAWPMALAFGITLIFAGLVTNVSTTAVGIVVTLAAAVGWWRQVLPVQHVEHVPLRPPAQRARPIVASRTPVGRGSCGEGGPGLGVLVVVPPISAGVQGGIVGGIAMAVVALFYGVLVQGSLWYPVNLLSAVAMPGMAQADLAQLRAFSGTALIVGILAHGVISVLVGLLYVVILPMLPRRHMLWGGLIGPLLWTGLLWGL